MSFAERLKKARIKSGQTQTRVAEKMGITMQSYTQYEKGKRNPRRETLNRIAHALNMGYNYASNGEPYFYCFVSPEEGRESEGNIFNRDQIRDAENSRSDREQTEMVESEDAARLLRLYSQLNTDGRDRAAALVEMLTKVPEYRKGN